MNHHRDNSIFKFNKLVIFILLLSVLTLAACFGKHNLRKLSTDEVVERLKNRKIDQFKLVYKDSLGNNLSEEFSKSFNQGKMIREFYVDTEDKIVEVRLFKYSHKKVFHEIQIRELLNHPFNNYNFIEIDCDKRDQILREVLKKDQEVRTGGEGNIYEIDASNQQIVYSIIKYCGWPKSEELITSMWYVVQHDPESEFAAFYYSNFVEFTKNGLLQESDLARMKDRMLMKNGYPQIYGSQIVGKSVYELRNPSAVNELRAKVGLGTIEANCKKHGFEFSLNDYFENDR